MTTLPTASGTFGDKPELTFPEGDAPTVPPGQGAWQKIGGGTIRHKHQRFALRTGGKRYRYYLVWITKLPPGKSSVQIAEIRLFRLSRS